jgi:CBS domain-containing protein
MKARDLMTANPKFGHRDTGLREVAQLMSECNCGSLPVVDDQDEKR